MIQTFKVIYYKTSYKKSLKTISFFITYFQKQLFKGFNQKVRSLRRGGGRGHWKANKNEQGEEGS